MPVLQAPHCVPQPWHPRLLDLHALSLGQPCTSAVLGFPPVDPWPSMPLEPARVTSPGRGGTCLPRDFQPHPALLTRTHPKLHRIPKCAGGPGPGSRFPPRGTVAEGVCRRSARAPELSVGVTCPPHQPSHARVGILQTLLVAPSPLLTGAHWPLAWALPRTEASMAGPWAPPHHLQAEGEDAPRRGLSPQGPRWQANVC